jgi:translation elongation factor EF-Tu-like GTPase
MNANAKLEFDLSNPDSKLDHIKCLKANDMASVLFEITHNLQKKVYWYFETPISKANEVTAVEGVEKVFEEIHKLMKDYDITDDLIS